ncbi:MAG: hypothetical protein ACKKL4_00975 [Patescibacteria group bacterium]
MPSVKPRMPKRVRKHVNPLADRTEIRFEGFGNTQPIIVDIGAYKGEFTSKLLGAFGRSYNYIVTEIRKPFAWYLEELFNQYGNVRVFTGNSANNIQGLLQSSVEQGSRIAYIFVNFPDPWLKDKHKKRRIVTRQFLDTLALLFDYESLLVFQTDQESLFFDTQALVDEMPQWEHEEYQEPLWGIQSHWERVKIDEGKDIYRMKISLKRK